MMTQTATNMASMQFEEQFRCCICLHTYIDPVSIPCGHNFCLDCIEGYWDIKEKSECPLCKETFKKRPELRINLGFAEIIQFVRSSQAGRQEEDNVVVPGGSKTPSLNQIHEAEEVPCDICYKQKSASVKSCLVCQASYCEIHLTPHLRDATLQKHRLTDPATFSSSHLCRKHNKPLTMFCKRDQMPVCVKCTEKEHKHHEAVPIERESKRITTNLKEMKAGIKQMIHDRLKKMEQIKNSVDLSKKITERDVQASAQICTMLITAIQGQQAELAEELEERQQEVERRADELLDELEQEINKLQMRGSELQHLETTRNPLHLLQSFPSLSTLPPTREWSEVAVHSNNSTGMVRRSISKLLEVCQDLVNKLSTEEVHMMHQYAVDVTLDPGTASGWLILSSDRKKVSVSSQKKVTQLPHSPQRFDSCVCILGKQNFKSGRHYWVVQVGAKTDWDLGLARESISRKGTITVRPDSGYWAICRRKGGSLSTCTSPSITLHLQKIPQKVGVFLDYNEGSVSFYNEDSKTHIYTFSGCNFTEPLYPYFNPCVQDNGKNTAPLIICPLEGTVREGEDITTETDV